MSAFSYLNEIVNSGFYESYTYKLTAKGEKYASNAGAQFPREYEAISKTVSTCKEFCGLRSTPLSYAAKSHYILASTEAGRAGQYTVDDVRRVGRDFDWNISPEDIETGVQLLEKLDLVRVS